MKIKTTKKKMRDPEAEGLARMGLAIMFFLFLLCCPGLVGLVALGVGYAKKSRTIVVAGLCGIGISCLAMTMVLTERSKELARRHNTQKRHCH